MLAGNLEDNSPNVKFLDKYFSIYTIRGRTNLIVFTSLGALLIITIFILLQNRHTRLINERIKHIRIEVPVASQGILSNLNYLLYLQAQHIDDPGNHHDKIQDQLWMNELLPNQNSLKNTRHYLKNQESRAALDSVNVLLERFRVSLRDVSNLLESSDLRRNIENAILDSVIQQKDNLILQNQAQINEIIRNVQTPTYNQLKNYLESFKDAEIPLLQHDIDKINSSIAYTNLWALLIAILALVFLIVLAYRANVQLASSVQKPADLISALAKGEVIQSEESTLDELKVILEESNKLSTNLEKASKFATEIGEGNFKSDFTPVSKYDLLGNALLQMRDRLLSVSEEDKKREWVSQGLAMFAEILRGHNEDFKEFSNKVISNLVRYLKANQGGIFIAGAPEDGSRYLELMSCYAYDRQKFMKRKIFIGEDFAEGLIGQAYLEQEIIYLTNVPEDHIHIVSGLGDGNPRCLLIVPLKLNHDVEGVLELASFEEFAPHQIEFVERLAQSIASSIISVKTGNRTRVLLEETQQQADELRSQEEEMRQNNEELAATQEEMRRKSMELERLLEETQEKEAEKTQALQIAQENEELLKTKNEEIAANEEELRQNMEELQTTRDNLMQSERRLFKFMESIPAGVVVTDQVGKPYFINDYAFAILGIPESEQNIRRENLFSEIIHSGIKGKYPKEQLPLNQALNGLSLTLDDLEIHRKDKVVYLEMTAQPIFDQDEHIEFAIAIFRDITESKLKNAEIQKQQAVFTNARDVMLILDQGKIIDLNQASLELFQVNEKNKLIGKTLVDLTPELKGINRDLGEILDKYYAICTKKGAYFFEWRMIDFQNKEFNCEVLLSAVPFQENILISAAIRDITERKIKDVALQKKNKELKENMEKLHKTQEEMREREELLISANNKIKANELVLKKAFAKSRTVEQELRLQLKEKDSEIEKLNLLINTNTQSNGNHSNISESEEQ